MPTPVIEKDATDERGTLLAFIDGQRDGIRNAVFGLTEEQAASRPSASELSLSGLLKHAVDAEAGWIARAKRKEPEVIDEAAMARWRDSFRLTGDETVAGVLARWEEVAAETERFVRSVANLEETFELPPVPWMPESRTVSIRWMLLHLVEELARHAGHADVIRESLDGKNEYELAQEVAAQG
ncbi:DinB family protein [Streptomyces orinoci]|uniref:DinB family protein n=1 Tax=Streptomyces orinoci TaxID=67339 RepID=A0ABV3JXT2_STRON|nr:DinB family protein [Streptomyces orinoci]